MHAPAVGAHPCTAETTAVYDAFPVDLPQRSVLVVLYLVHAPDAVGQSWHPTSPLTPQIDSRIEAGGITQYRLDVLRAGHASILRVEQLSGRGPGLVGTHALGFVPMFLISRCASGLIAGSDCAVTLGPLLNHVACDDQR